MQLTRFFTFNSRISSFGIFFILMVGALSNTAWKSTKYPMQYDANGYYIYLPAVFIHHDLTLKFVGEDEIQFDRTYFLYKTKNGGYLNKYPPGMTILALPFFLIAHAASYLVGLETSGYSVIYRLCLVLCTVFYGCLGIWMLRKLLLRFFSDSITAFTLILVGLGTNYFFYSSFNAGLTHNCLFFLFACILNVAEDWKTSHSTYDLAKIAFFLGLVFIVRPSEILMGIPVAFFFFQFAMAQLKENPSKAFQKVSVDLLTAIVVGLLAISPIFLYWKLATGHFVHYAYEQEGFYFDRPAQIFYGLFGFRKGWFIYTPVAFFAILGIYFLVKSKAKSYLTPILFYLPISIILILSWWCWWYGGCFGQRSFISSLALLALPLAALVEASFHKKQLKNAVIGIGVCLVLLNLFQSLQYRRQTIHHDSMTLEAYKFSFGRLSFSKDQKAQFEKLLDHPDYSQWGKKLDEYFK